MTGIFADTSFFVAFLNPDDECHANADGYMANHAGKILSTDWVLVELGNYFAGGSNRKLVAPFISQLRKDPRFNIVRANDSYFELGVELYDRRLDKRWSLTDCISFIVMQRQGLNAALTADHHFQQAGFEILLR
jgi:uncharacterized protein